MSGCPWKPVSLPPINMEPDMGLLEESCPFHGTPCKGNLASDGWIVFHRSFGPRPMAAIHKHRLNWSVLSRESFRGMGFRGHHPP